MKRRFFVLFLFTFMSLLFMGCDFLGGATTTTTQTTTEEVTTTESTTPTTETTADPSTTTTTSADQTTTTTSAEQTTTTTTTQQSTTTTSADQTTTTTTTQQSTTTTTTQQSTTTTTQQSTTTTTTQQSTTTTTQQSTTTTTAEQTTTTTTNADTTTTTTTQVGELDVTFIDWDGTVLEVETVVYGGDATPPADPTRPSNGFYSYDFSGWDIPFTNVTTSITVQAQYSVSYDSPTAYSHENLLALVSTFTGSSEPADLEADVTMMMEMTGAVSEHELFDMMNGLMELMQDFQAVQTAQDLQDLFAKSVVLGFDADMIARLGFNLLYGSLNEERQYILTEIADLEAQIVDLEAEIVQSELDMAAKLLEAQTYCTTTDYNGLCQTYINNTVAELLADNAYYDMLYTTDFGETFDWWAYSDLEGYYADYVYARDVDMDSVQAEEYQNYYMSYYNSFSPEHQAIIDDLLVLYDAYQVAQNNFYLTNYDDLYNLDANEKMILDVVQEHLFGYYDFDNDEYIDGYVDFYWQIDHNEWFIFELSWEIEWLEKSLVSINSILDYLDDEANAENARELIRILYDALFATTGEIDQEMIDFINMIMMSMKEGTPIEHLINPENITYVVNKLGGILGAFEATLSEEDYLVITEILKSVIPIMVSDPEMTELEKEMLANEIATLIDVYMPIVRATASDLIGFFDAFTQEKAERILDLVFMIGKDPASMDLLVYNIASAYEVVLGDGSFDVKALILNTVDIYYLATTELNPDPLVVAATKVTVGANVDQILLLATEISGFDPSGLTPANLAVIDELIARVENLILCYTWGFESAESDFTNLYQESDFYELLKNLGYMDEEQAKIDIMLMLNETDEETAYYKFRALINYATYLMSIHNFSDLQSWVANIEQFGFTQEQVLDIFLGMIEKELVAQAEGDYWYQQELQSLQDQVDFYNQQMEDSLLEIDNIEAEITGFIAGLDPSLQADATAYWEAYKLYRTNEEDYYDAFWNIELLIGMTNLNDLEAAYEELYYALNADPIVQADIDAAQAEFDSIYNMFSAEKQYQVDLFLELFENYFVHYQFVYLPLFNSLDNNALYSGFMVFLDDQGSNYNYLLTSYYSYMEDRDYFLGEIQNLMGQNQDILMILGVIENNRNLVLNVMNILFDDVEYMLANTPETAFAEIHELIKFMSLRHGTFEEFTTADILALLQDFSALMKLRGTTIDATEEAIIEDFIEVIVIAIAENEGMENPEKDAFVALVTPIFIKYLGFADTALTEFTDLIDTLTQADIDMLVDAAHSFYQPMSDFDRVIMLAGLVDGIINTPEFDLGLILNMGLEIYFDTAYEFDYLEADLTAVQTAFGVFVGDTMTLIGNIAAIDQTNMTTADIAMILELQDRVEFLGMIMNYPEAILDGYTYAYSSADFENLVMMVFPDLDSFGIDARIAGITAAFGMTEEESYYLFTAILSTLRGVEYVRSISDVAQVYQSLHNIGLTNAEIAEYGLALFMEIFYPELPAMYDTTVLESDIADYETELLIIQDDLYDIDNTVYDQLDLLTDPVLTDAVNLWEFMKVYQESVADLNQWSESGEYYYDYDLYYYELIDAFNKAYETGDWSDVEEIQYNYGIDQQQLDYFQMLYEKERDAEINGQMLEAMITQFEMNYPGQMVADGSMTLLSLMTSMESNYYGYYNNYHWIMMLIEQYEYELMMIQENAVFFETIYDFLSVQANVDATESMLLILLDEIDALTLSPDLKVFDFFMQFTFDHTQLAKYSPAELSAEINRMSAFFGLMFNSIDATEVIEIKAYINSLADVFVDNLGLVDPQDAIDLKAEIGLLVDTYVEDLLAVPDIFSVFLASFDAVKTQELLDILVQFHKIDHYSDISDLQAAVIISQVIVLLDDDSLDYETLIGTVFGFMYDVALTTGYPGEYTTTQVLDNISLTIDAILLQAVIVGNLGVNEVTLADAATVQALIALFDELGLYFNLE